MTFRNDCAIVEQNISLDCGASVEEHHSDHVHIFVSRDIGYVQQTIKIQLTSNNFAILGFPANLPAFSSSALFLIVFGLSRSPALHLGLNRMADFQFSCCAYCKMILHALKYPHASVSGLLIGEKKKGTNSYRILDSVPLQHQSATCLVPTVEAALYQVGDD